MTFLYCTVQYCRTKFSLQYILWWYMVVSEEKYVLTRGVDNKEFATATARPGDLTSIQ